MLTSDSGMRRNVPKVLVVVTDGRSQDEVKKSAEKLQHSGMCEVIIFVWLCIVLKKCTGQYNCETFSFLEQR